MTCVDNIRSPSTALHIDDTENKRVEKKWPNPEQMRKDFDRRMKVVSRIAAGTQFLSAILRLIGSCALAWGSAVLLGAYVNDLSIGDFYGVGVLLLAEGIRLWLAGRVSQLRHRVTVPVRFLMQLAVFGISSSILVTAVYSLLPYDAQTWMRRRVFEFKGYSPPPPGTGLRRSLRIFYGLMLVDGLTACIGVVFLNLERWQHVESHKCLEAYHDRLVGSGISSDSEALNWLAGRYFPAPHFLFEVLGQEYRSCTTGIVADTDELACWCPFRLFKYHPGTDSDQPTDYSSVAERICKDYRDLIWHAYLQEAGFEAAEGALGGGDPYERGAVANVLVCWAALEEGLAPQQVRPPLRFQQRLLSRLADVAADSYGWAGCAAATLFALLLERSSTDPATLVTQVHSADGNQRLLDILIERVNLCTRQLAISWPTNASWGHIQAIGCLLRRLNPQSSPPNIVDDLYDGLIGANSNIDHRRKLDCLKAGFASDVEELQNLKQVLTTLLTKEIPPLKPVTLVATIILVITLLCHLLGLSIINGLLLTF